MAVGLRLEVEPDPVADLFPGLVVDFVELSALECLESAVADPGSFVLQFEQRPVGGKDSGVESLLDQPREVFPDNRPQLRPDTSGDVGDIQLVTVSDEGFLGILDMVEDQRGAKLVPLRQKHGPAVQIALAAHPDVHGARSLGDPVLRYGVLADGFQVEGDQLLLLQFSGRCIPNRERQQQSEESDPDAPILHDSPHRHSAVTLSKGSSRCNPPLDPFLMSIRSGTLWRRSSDRASCGRS